MYTEWLLDRGAEVVGVDASEAMLAHARERVGDRATFHQADLGKPLDQFPPDDPGDANYYEIERRVKKWEVDVPYYRRPLGEIIRRCRPTSRR